MIVKAVLYAMMATFFHTACGSSYISRPVAVYCRSGRRRKVAAEKLTDNGFSVTELDGGIISWKGELTK